MSKKQLDEYEELLYKRLSEIRKEATEYHNKIVELKDEAEELVDEYKAYQKAKAKEQA